MLRGLEYWASDPRLVAEREAAHRLCFAFNAKPPGSAAIEFERLKASFGACGENLYVEPPFYCDYGYNLEFGNSVYLNFNCTILDCARIAIGDGVKFGPGVQLYAAGHSLDPDRRAQGYEFARPIAIGRNAWLGGGAIVLPGVAIGEHCVIGAGSVVTRDIPDRAIAVGNPCCPIRTV